MSNESAAKPVNYTEEMVDRMVAMYQELGNEGLEDIAKELDRPVRAVRSKLVREGVYVASVKPAKAAKREGPTKKEMLNTLEGLVPFEVDGFMGATKDAIGALIAFAESVQVSEPQTEASEVSEDETASECEGEAA